MSNSPEVDEALKYQLSHKGGYAFQLFAFQVLKDLFIQINAIIYQKSFIHLQKTSKDPFSTNFTFYLANQPYTKHKATEFMLLTQHFQFW